MTIATVDHEGRVIIPRSIREQLDIKAGDCLLFRVEGEDRLVVQRVHQEATEAAGKPQEGLDHGITLAQMDRANARRMDEEIRLAGWIPTSWSAISTLDDPDHS